ncbi:uncharacterized mitochondrial protein AtMg00810-like [Rutidosis leptorrhynchoides]|uniref:uncharacterized mitochondrial protein AtMg00810-like n=1 Tax=Rutidosis leptorrhynchoides TaxID=125765 RepID=UPI003A99D123
MAQLVAQGFTQIPGIDYSATFSPVVKSSTVRIVLSLATLNKWSLHQLDVKNAFLNENLTENVFMEQLPGNDNSFVRKFISRLHSEFAIKDLGALSYFLGLEVTYTSSGLFLSQTKYAHDVLTRAKLLDSKPVATPLATAEVFSSKGTPFSDHTLYRSLVGALQYLTITRPDISYAVNQVSQFLQAPTFDHFQAVKRILRYVKGTIAYGLSFHHSPMPSILGYSDADWARCLDTRCSTYGYSIFLGGNLVSWSAKKQSTIARSSCESKYQALANTAADVVWLLTFSVNCMCFLLIGLLFCVTTRVLSS